MSLLMNMAEADHTSQNVKLKFIQLLEAHFFVRLLDIDMLHNTFTITC